MIASIQNIFNIPELRRRIFFTLGMLAVYRIGCHIPTPGIDSQVLAQFFAGTEGTLLGLVSAFHGWCLRADDDLRFRDHALYQCLNHSSVVNCRL